MLEGSKERYVFVTFMIFCSNDFWVTNKHKKAIHLVHSIFFRKNTKIFWINTLTRNIHRSMANTTNEKYKHNDKWNWYCHVSSIFPLYKFASFSDVFVIYLSISRQSIFNCQNMYICKEFNSHFFNFHFFRCNATFYTLES